MQIVIDIPNSLYANLQKIERGSIASKRVLDCVRNGTPLPKGHGRLIDENQIAGDSSWDIADRLDATPTIIEADLEEKE